MARGCVLNVGVFLVLDEGLHVLFLRRVSSLKREIGFIEQKGPSGMSSIYIVC